jgi:hypothetical protein
MMICTYGYLFVAWSILIYCIGIHLLKQPQTIKYLGDTLWLFSWPLTPIVCTLRLVWYLLHERGKRETYRGQRFAVSLLISTLISIPPALLVAVANSISLQNQQLGLFLLAFDLRYLWVLALVFIAGAVVRYQAFKTQSPVLTSIPLMAFSGFCASALTGILFLHHQSQTPHGTFLSPMLPAFVTILTASLVWFSRPTWQRLYGQWLYRRGIEVQEIGAFGNRLLAQSQEMQPYQAVVEALAQAFGLRHVSLWRWNPQTRHHGLFNLLAISEPEIIRPSQVQASPIEIINAFDDSNSLRLNERVLPFPDSFHALSSNSTNGMIIPVRRGLQLLGILELGERSDGDITTDEDLKAMDAAVSQVALFLDLTDEKDKYRHTTRVIHDETLGTFQRLIFGLSRFESNINSKLLQSGLRDMQTDIANEVQNLRDILNGAVYRTPSDFQALIKRYEVIYKWQFENQLDLLDKISSSSQRAIYRWTTEALNNVGKHAQATNVRIIIRSVGANFELCIEDNGIGFDVAATRHNSNKGNSYGLQNLQRGAQEQGGNLTIWSEPGRGTRLTFLVPIDAVR